MGFERSGKIAEQDPANIVIAKNNHGSNSLDSFFSLNPEDILLILHNGEIKLLDTILSDKINVADFKVSNFRKINIGESCKYVEDKLQGVTIRLHSFYHSEKKIHRSWLIFLTRKHYSHICT